MQPDHVLEWRRLSEHYREIGDEELRELAAGFSDLTETAQQVLRDELRHRGMGEPQAAAEATGRTYPAAALAAQPLDSITAPLESESAEGESDAPVEYTWKTMLCECNDHEEAWQISATLKQSGIESWIDGPRSRYVMSMTSPRVMVAADQLEQARAVLSRPIPREIIEESRQSIPEFVAPKCPECGAGDPVLESADPVNAWRCESCGRQWSDAAEGQAEETQTSG
jgi:translation initiation factor 2 beta subunit (eIF-2beta)/eIF-5